MNPRLAQTLLHFMERRYLEEHLRLLLDTCLTEQDVQPLTTFVESLVVEGPRHLPVLARGLAEVRKRKQQVLDDLAHLWKEFLRVWDTLDLPPFPEPSPHSLLHWDSQRLAEWARQVGVDTACIAEGQRVLRNTQTLYRDAMHIVQLLQEMESCLQDWLFGMTYQAIHTPSLWDSSPSSPSQELC